MTGKPATTGKKPKSPSAADAAKSKERMTKDDAAAHQMQQELVFTSDKGAARSTWIAAFLVLAIVGWMGSGFIFPTEKASSVARREDPAPVSVAVTNSVADTVTQYYQAEGQALPDRDTKLRAEISGDIAEVLVVKGQDVKAGSVIARFDPTNNEADAKRAAEELARVQREFDNAEKLLERGVATADRVVQARAALASAQAQVIAVAQSAKALTITAPFDGRIETLDLDAGEFVSSGAEVGRLVDITPLTVAIQVPQQSLTRLAVGQTAKVKFITGEEREGTVTFVGSAAASETRTFLAEIEVANEDGAIPAGISAEVVIPTGEVVAHFLTASIVSLDTSGTLGVKTVNADKVVEFFPIEIVRAQIDGLWVTGLPETVDVITVGQGYVNDGETVVPSAAEKPQ
ncbi:efflux RND transporter periplasmic adaptor subunit [Sulfitobacter sp. F26204]|uniref:efflux RND transporter periplasmic adaptor subunit n=1 Tax=Sulfitobacter sp. F26204 TaxID=2996014 RepID=UPI00225E6ADA|nr:efflux RND transporter periplasmic adaptor subunit [Sulfitobacter sp. F26204]MCX7558395.1 efflux RND transporter periplasmic adaptor subunit [Sulfitobacter sp. F26204]